MNQHFTVYFDTNFYIWLGAASPENAARVISVFNERNIRYVLSSFVVLELLSGRERSSQDRELVSRLKGWNLAPYPIPFGYSPEGEVPGWDLLLLSGNQRQEHSEELKKIFDLETTARSFSHIAEKPLSNAQKCDLEKSLEPFHESIGIKNESNDAEKTAAYMIFVAQQLSSLKHFFSPETAKKIDGLDLATPTTAERLNELALKLKDILTDPVVSRLEEDNQLMNSVLTLDPRPLAVASGKTSSSEIKKLGNSMRDAVHMSAFVAHSEEIDLLQVDSRQLSLIQRSRPEHFMQKKGLAGQCFSAPNLDATVMYILKRISE